MTVIAHILGGWSVNIGNAFFQLAGYEVLRELLPEAEFALIPEQPGYPSYWNHRGGNPAHSLDYINTLKPDVLVLMGPVFRREMFSIWGDALEKLMKGGSKLVLLGVGAMSYDPADVEIYRDFLIHYPPHLMVARDAETYRLLGDLSAQACAGIDLAFFLSDYFPQRPVPSLQGSIVLNFDKIPEPRITVGEGGGNFDQAFDFNGQRWQIKFPRFRAWLARRSRYGMFLEGILFPGSKLTELGGYRIIRTDHRPHPMLRAKTYRSPGVLVNDTPFPYLSLYGNVALTLTDRVHAAVAALQYGKPAMLFSESPRLRLLEGLGVDEITQRPVWLDLARLEEEKHRVKNFIRQGLA